MLEIKNNNHNSNRQQKKLVDVHNIVIFFICFQIFHSRTLLFQKQGLLFKLINKLNIITLSRIIHNHKYSQSQIFLSLFYFYFNICHFMQTPNQSTSFNIDNDLLQFLLSLKLESSNFKQYLNRKSTSDNIMNSSDLRNSLAQLRFSTSILSQRSPISHNKEMFEIVFAQHTQPIYRYFLLCQKLESNLQQQKNQMSKTNIQEFGLSDLSLSVIRHIQKVRTPDKSDYWYPPCLTYNYSHHSLQMIYQKHPKTYQSPQFLKIQCQIPSQIIQEYVEAEQKNEGAKMPINFRQGFIKSWGYLYYSIQKIIYLINPCKQLLPDLFHLAQYQLDTNNQNPLQSETSSTKSIKPLYSIKFDLPDALVELIETGITLEHFIKLINSDEQPGICSQCDNVYKIGGDSEVILFVHPWYIDIYGLTRKTINTIWQSGQKYKKMRSKGKNIDDDSQLMIRNIEGLNPFRNLHIRYKLKCSIPYNISIDRLSGYILYSDSKNCLNNKIHKINITDRFKTNSPAPTIFNKLNKSTIILNNLKRNKTVHRQQKNNNRTLLQQISVQQKQLPTKIPRLMDKIHTIYKQWILKLKNKNLLRDPIHKFTYKLSNIFSEQTKIVDLKLISTRYCQVDKVILNLYRFAVKQPTQLLICPNKYSIEIIDTQDESSHQDNFSHIEIQPHISNKQSYFPVSICHTLCPYFKTKPNRCAILIQYQSNIQQIIEIDAESKQTKKIHTINSQHTENSAKQHNICSNHQASVLVLNDKHYIKIANYLIESSYSHATEHYLHQYYDPSDIAIPLTPRNYYYYLPQNQKNMHIHSTDNGYQIILKIRLAEKILSLIYGRASITKKQKATIFEELQSSIASSQMDIGLAIMTVLTDITGRYTIYGNIESPKEQDGGLIFTINFQELESGKYAYLRHTCMQYLLLLRQREISTIKQFQPIDENKQIKIISPDRLFKTISIDSPLVKTAEKSSGPNRPHKNTNDSERSEEKLGNNILESIAIAYLKSLLQRYWSLSLCHLEENMVVRQFQRFLEFCREINDQFQQPVITLKNLDQVVEVSEFDSEKTKRNRHPQAQEHRNPQFIEMVHEIVYFVSLLSVSLPLELLEKIRFSDIFTLRKMNNTKLITLLLNKQQLYTIPDVGCSGKPIQLMEKYHEYLFNYYIEKCEEQLEVAWHQVCPNLIPKAFQSACKAYVEVCPIKNRNNVAEKVLKHFKVSQLMPKKDRIYQFIDTAVIQGLQNEKNEARTMDEDIKTTILSKIPYYFLNYLKTNKQISLRDLMQTYKRQEAIKKQELVQINKEESINTLFLENRNRANSLLDVGFHTSFVSSPMDRSDENEQMEKRIK